MNDSPDHDNDPTHHSLSRAAASAHSRRPAETSDAKDPTEETTAGFTQFYREKTKPVMAFLLWQGATVAEAADLVQDAMILAYRRWNTLNNPHAWVRTTVSRDLIRLRVDHHETPVDPPPQPPLLRGGDIEGWELRHDLLQALATLPPRQRQVMAWSLEGHTVTEIAHELGLELGTVRQHLYLARKTLSAHLLTRKETRP